MTALGRRLLAGVFTFITLVWSFRLVPDSDWYLHVAYGKQILLRGTVDFPDPFLWSEPGRIWFDHHWGAQIIFAWLEPLGFSVTALLVSAVAALTTWVVVTPLFSRLRPALSLPIAFLFCWVIVTGATARPHIFSYLTFSLLLLAWRKGAPWWVFGLIACAWANLHGSISIGLGALLLLCLDRFYQERKWNSFAPVLGATAGALINVHGPALLLYAGGFIDKRFAILEEWQSPSFREPTYWGLLGFILLGVYLVRKAVRVPAVYLLLLGGFLGATLIASRHGPYFAITLLFVVAMTYPTLPPVTWLKLARLETLLFTPLFCLILIIGFSGVSNRPDPFNYPSASALAALPKGDNVRLFSRYEWGGLLDYQGSQPFIDGRADLVSLQLLDDYRAMVGGRPGSLALLESYQVSHVFLNPNDGLARLLLQKGSCFVVSYEDPSAVLLERQGTCR